MTRLIGPMHSDDASGSFAGVTVYSKWKGRNYARLLVTPINRNTTGQKTVRSILGTLAKACKAVLTAKADTVTNVGSPFFISAVAGAISTQSWISSLQKRMNSQFDGLVTAYGLLTTVAGFFDTEAVSIGLAPYVDKMGVTHDAGEQLYMLASYAVVSLGYTGFAAGIDSATSPEAIAFAAFVHEA